MLQLISFFEFAGRPYNAMLPRNEPSLERAETKLCASYKVRHDEHNKRFL